MNSAKPNSARSSRSLVLPMALAFTLVTAVHTVAAHAGDGGSDGGAPTKDAEPTTEAGHSGGADAGDLCAEQGGHWSRTTGCMGAYVCELPDGRELDVPYPQVPSRDAAGRTSTSMHTPALFGAGCC